MLVEALSALSVSPAVAGEPGVIVVEVNEVRVRIRAGATSALIAATLKALRP